MFSKIIIATLALAFISAIPAMVEHYEQGRQEEAKGKAVYAAKMAQRHELEKSVAEINQLIADEVANNPL